MTAVVAYPRRTDSLTAALPMYPVAPTTAIFSPVQDSPATAGREVAGLEKGTAGANAEADEARSTAARREKALCCMVVLPFEWNMIEGWLLALSGEDDITR
jgi:hypothetical protein